MCEEECPDVILCVILHVYVLNYRYVWLHFGLWLCVYLWLLLLLCQRGSFV